MSTRRGISLIEVLVAASLLAIGVAGTLAALATSLRVRAGAWALEHASAAAQDRLSWFVTNACLSGDTLIVGAAPAERWRVRRDADGATIEGSVTVAAAGRERAIRADARVPC